MLSVTAGSRLGLDEADPKGEGAPVISNVADSERELVSLGTGVNVLAAEIICERVTDALAEIEPEFDDENTAE